MAKPRPPKLNPKVFEQCKSPMEVTRIRFEILDEHRRKGDLPTTYITLDALSSIQAARELGFSEAEVRSTWSASWGDQEVVVPAALLNNLKSAWLKYRDAPPGTTLGEAFNLEGGGQGKASARNQQMTRDKHRGLADDVEIVYFQAMLNNKPISEEEAQETVAARLDLSFETVRNAHKKFKPEIRAALQKQNEEID